MRVIGTGWRYWATSDAAVEDMFSFMDQLLDLILLTQDPVLQLIIGGGGDNDPYTQGADRYLYKWAEANTDYHGLKTVPEPIIWDADWEQYGNAAGPIRNAHMITCGADLVAGFLHPESKGTRDCLSKAKRANIARMVVPWRPDQDPVTKPQEAERGTARQIPVPTEFKAEWPKPYPTPLAEAA